MKQYLERTALALMRRMDPERAHALALRALAAGMGPHGGPTTSPRLMTEFAGLQFANPVGLAAGFDKNATAIAGLYHCGFGFLEFGAATPRPQPGNPRPRLFRLSEDKAAINRFGFNNDGMEAIARRLEANGTGRQGINLGANKDSEDKAADFAAVLKRCGPHVDFATVNVSSPNTEKLRDLQGKAALAALLERVMEANDSGVPVFLKIAPDLNEDEMADIAEVAGSSGVAAIVATNTTLSREGLTSRYRDEAGGLSGQPLFERSTRFLAKLSTMTDLPLIGVGGVGSARQAYEKIRAGASAVQLYTAMVYRGVRLPDEIALGLDMLLERDGFSSIAEAKGSGRSDWL
ncbi:quinone-dependent dihydroorotate dehydrogenase [Pelagovum pacificum]|uniref:Dihydroorotate dehydrogenase (quinone) n=1 Tax=Pelagovum pacificum TaxID=2588711 RepID=A0A5C5GEQ0_9RHOB|nr:quinone-dependent dihydroorotate dehydrogenase [Pelagovum pacificum]QQA43683.1 quinone-dependent dihydroorotate dehydrogenase [Pelagovum pacificum]TNY33183.1 quinone-dependent dihydroorotate dehydrogenase [Pelagovum pacificum]